MDNNGLMIQMLLDRQRDIEALRSENRQLVALVNDLRQQVPVEDEDESQ